MLNLKSIAADRGLSVWIASTFAEDALHIFERKYPSDMRPRKAIEAAKAWMNNPCKETASAASAASADAFAADAFASASASSLS